MNAQHVSTEVRNLLEQAKNLSEDERILLADLLYEESSLTEEEWEAAWLAECERRLGEYERGEVEAEDFDVAMERLRQKHSFKE